MDLAQHMGIKVTQPKDSGLLRDPMPYPDCYETHFALMSEKKSNFIGQAIGQKEIELQMAAADLHRVEGRMMYLNEIGAPPEIRGQTEQLLMNAHVRRHQIESNLNQLRGELGATNFYRKLYVFGLNDPNGKA